MDTVDGFSDPVSVLVGREELCAEVLGALPKWFGRPSAVDTYVAASRDQPMLACFGSDGVVGMLSLKLHTTATAEIHVLGVKPDWHRRGVGRALIRAAMAEAVTRELKFLTVKTLASSYPDVNYAGNRRFYEAMGFLEVEEFATLWGPGLPCLLMAMSLDGQRGSVRNLDDAAIRTNEMRLLEAATRANSAAVIDLLHDDFIEFGSSGRTFDKAVTVSGLAAEDRAEPRTFRELSGATIRHLGPDAALITYKVVRRTPGVADKTSLRSSVWVRSGGNWRLLFHQGTLAASGETPSWPGS